MGVAHTDCLPCPFFDYKNAPAVQGIVLKKEESQTQIALFCVNQCKFLGLRDRNCGHELFFFQFRLNNVAI